MSLAGMFLFFDLWPGPVLREEMFLLRYKCYAVSILNRLLETFGEPTNATLLTSQRDPAFTTRD